MWSYVATIYRVIQMKFTKFADENVRYDHQLANETISQ